MEGHDLKRLCKLSEKHILRARDAYLLKLRAENSILLDRRASMSNYITNKKYNKIFTRAEKYFVGILVRDA